MEGTCWAIDEHLYHHPHPTPTLLSHAHFLGNGDFSKNLIDIGQKSILTKVRYHAQVARNWFKSVPRGLIDPHLSWNERRTLLGEYEFSAIFGDFGIFEKIPKYGLPPLKYGQRPIVMRN